MTPTHGGAEMNADDLRAQFAERCMSLLEHASKAYDAATNDAERASLNAYAEGIAAALEIMKDLSTGSEAA